MIDTVRFEVNGLLSTNARLYDELTRWSEGKIKHDLTGVRGQIQRELYVDVATKKVTETFRIMHKLASSNYKITIRVTDADKMVIEYSMPKYYFGNNILQICDSPLDKKFNFGKGLTDSLEYQFSNIYPKFVAHAKNFFNSEFPAIPVDYTKVVLRRIDLCFNQMFRTKEDAIQFLEEQKKYAKRNIKTSKEYNYKESIFITTKNYTFKIYHKGPEFKTNDSKKIGENANSKEDKLKRAETINRMQNIADRILRYELTFRNSQISYLYTSKLFRCNSKDFQAKKIVYNKLKYIQEKEGLLIGEAMQDKESMLYKKVMYFNTRVLPSRQISFLTYLLRKYHKNKKREPTLEMVGKYYYDFYKDFDKLLNTQRDFILKLPLEYLTADDDSIMYDHENDTMDMRTVPEKLLSSEIFALMSKMFIDTIKEFQPQRMDSSFSMTRLLTKHNEMILQKKQNYRALNETSDSSFMSPNLYKLIFLAMEKNSLRTIKKMLNIPKVTYWRMKNNLKILGISEDAILEPLEIESDLSYNRYYTFINENIYTFLPLFVNKRLW